MLGFIHAIREEYRICQAESKRWMKLELKFRTDTIKYNIAPIWNRQNLLISKILKVLILLIFEQNLTKFVLNDFSTSFLLFLFHTEYVVERTFYKN